MNYIKNLLKGQKVEWKTLGDEEYFLIANNKRKPVKASERNSGDIPYYGANNIQDYVDGYTHDGTYILIAEDGTKSLENYSIQWASGKFWANNHVHVVGCKENIDSRFVFHYLQTINFIPFLSGGDRAKLTKAKLVEIPIPLPPLPVQQEIANILDKFTTLEAELEAELEARKKQYEYYRNQLLTFTPPHCNRLIYSTLQWKTLGEVCSVLRGKRLTKKELIEDGEYPVFHGGLIPLGRYDKFNRKANQTMVINTGSVGEVVWSGVDFWSSDGTFVVETNNQVDDKFLYHFLKTKENDFKNQKREGGVPTIERGVIERLKIPIPPIEEQKRIVNILDKFDTLTNSITEGLPKEIELRRKQYEYYREKLLMFND